MHHDVFKSFVNIGFTTISSFVSELQNNASVLGSYESFLDSTEMTKYRRFRCSNSQFEYLCAHVLTRTLLSSSVAINPVEWRFKNDDLGKPRIANENGHGLSFSLSHTRELVACAVGAHREIGLDVERIAPDTPIEDLATNLFAPAELDAFRCMTESSRRARFFQTWTLKEAYLKATGQGLLTDLKSFGIHYAKSGPELFFVNSDMDSAARWQLNTLQLSPEHAGAIVIEKRGTDPVLLHIQSHLPLITLQGS